MSRPPLHLILELARASCASEPNAVAGGEWNRYLLRWPDDSGRYEQGELVWDAATRSALSAAADAATAQTAIDQLAAVMRSLVDTAGWSRIVERMRAARGLGRAVAVTLRPAAHELYALPWELLDLAGTPLYATEDCVLRYAIAGDDAHPRRPPPSTRVLVAAAAAGGGVPVAEHVAAIADAARAGRVAFHAERDVLAGATYDGLQRALGAADASILHLLCHGEALSGGRGFGLRLDPDRDPVTPREMAELLAPHAGTLRLVVLAACFGAAPPAIDHALENVAQAIHAAGIAAVIASRYLLTSSGSIELTRVLYDQLWCRKASLQTAFVASRTALRVRQHDRSDVDAMAVQLHGGNAPSLDFRPWIFRPYRGLTPYERADASFYVGRDDDRRALLRLVDAALAQGGPRFVLVAGGSGTGKSSVVRAGLVPDLEAGQLARVPRWTAAYLRPGEAGAPLDVLAGLALDGRPWPDGSALALVVDQLEEIFTEIDRDDAREAFLREIWRLACEPGGRVFVIATIRIEYMGRLGNVQMDDGTAFDRVMLAAGRYHLLHQLGLAEYERIIRCPAELAGLQIERGLVERLLEGLRTEPGALPLLSFTLDRLWLERSFQTAGIDDPAEPGREHAVTGWWLTHASYVALGGIAGALARSADQLLRALAPAETDQLRRVLVQLVQGHDDPQLVTRRRGWREQLRPDPVAAPAAADMYDRVLDIWIRERLLVSGSASPGAPVWLELAHDSLIRLWPTFRGWYAEARAWLGQADELLGAALDWRAHAGGDAESYVLRGQRLAYHLEAWERYRVQLGAQDRELADRFLDACRRADAEHRARELEAERRSAVAEERAVAARDAVIMLAALQLRDAGQPAWATKLLAEVARPLLTPGWLAFAWDHLSRTPLASTLRDHGGEVVRASFSPDGAFVLTVSLDGDARLWRADGRGAPVILRDHPATVRKAVFSPDSALVMTIDADGVVRRWRVDGAAPPALLGGGDSAIANLELSPDGQRFVTSGDHRACVWRVDQPRPAEILDHGDDVFAASFSPDASWVVTLCADGAARLWRTDDRVDRRQRQARRTAAAAELRHPDSGGLAHGVCQASFTRDGRSVVTLAFKDSTVRIWPLDDLASPRAFDAGGEILASSADGQRLASAAGRVVLIWDIADVDAPRELVLPGWVTCAALSWNGARLATAVCDEPRVRSPSRTIYLWDVDRRDRPIAQLSGHDDSVTALAFSADGRRLLSASNDRTARIWRADEDRSEVLSPPAGEWLFRAALCPDGAILAASRGARASEADGAIVQNLRDHRLWRVTGSESRSTLASHDADIVGLAFSPDGTCAVTGTRDGQVRVWSLAAAERRTATSFAGHQGAVQSAAFSSDSKRVITGSADGTARVWSLDGPVNAVVLAGHAGGVRAASFSADGRFAATGASDGAARVWRLAEPRDAVIVRGHAHAVDAVALGRDARHLLTRCDDATARVWRLDSSDPQAPVILADAVRSAAFSDDGARIVLGSYDGSVQIRYLDDPGRCTVVEAHAHEVTAAAFSPDGEWVATASYDRTARISRVTDPSQFIVLRHLTPVISVHFSADSARVLTVTEEGASLWTIDVESVRRRLRSASTDCLPPDLRQRYLGETAAQASSRHADCERSHGRTPRAD